MWKREVVLMANHEYILRCFDSKKAMSISSILGDIDSLFEKHNAIYRTDDYFKNMLSAKATQKGISDSDLTELIKLYRNYYRRVPVMESYFIEFLEKYPDYVAFIHSACMIFNELFVKAEYFTDLVNADRVPEGFINALAEGLSYEFTENVAVAYQREILKRLLMIYRERGAEADIIIKGQQYGNEGYIGGKVFVPGTYEVGYAMSITFPREELFRHSEGTRSTKYRYPNIDYYRDGLVSFNTPIINDKIKEAVASVMPAGVTIVFTYMIEAKYPFEGIIGNDTEGTEPIKKTHQNYLFFDSGIHTFDYNNVQHLLINEETGEEYTVTVNYNCFDGENCIGCS